jgi:hypothetical protein
MVNTVPGNNRPNWLSSVQRRLRGFRPGPISPFLVILFLAVLLFVIFLALFSSHYETNDDAAMNMYAAGENLGQTPSEFLLFQHFVVGLILKFLYLNLPHFPWYGAFLYGYLFISSVVIAYAFARLRRSFGSIVSWLALFFLFYLPVLVAPQFTACSGYLAIAGIVLLYVVVQKPSPSRALDRCLVGLALLILIWAGMVRFYSLLLALLVMCPIYGYALVTRFSQSWRRLLPILCGVAATGLFLNWTQLEYYEKARGWEHFFAYNDVRADFMDRHRIVWNEQTEPLFKKVGWSRNDLAMLMSWFYLDPKIYSFANLSFVARKSSWQPGPPIAWNVLRTDLWRSLTSYGGLAALLLCILLWSTRFSSLRTFALVALLWYAMLFTGITVVERHLPARVWLVMLCGWFVTEMILWCAVDPVEARAAHSNRRRAVRAFWPVAGAVVLICLCAGSFASSNRLSDKLHHDHLLMMQDLARLNPRPNQLFVTWGGDFPYETFQLPKESDSSSRDMEFLGLGVGNHDPVVQDRLRAFGIHDLYQALYQRNDIFLICMLRKEDLLSRYIEEHYHTRVVVQTIFEGNTFRVCKVMQAGKKSGTY